MRRADGKNPLFQNHETALLCFKTYFVMRNKHVYGNFNLT